MSRSWGVPERDHTFASGRTATLREQLPLHVLVRSATADNDRDLLEAIRALDRGDLEDPIAAMALQDAMVQAMFIRPRIVLPGAEELADGDDTILITALDDSELDEVVTLVMEGVAEAARFRGERNGARGGSGKSSVGGKAKRATKPAAGKPRGART